MEFNLEELKTEIETTKNGYMASLSLLDLAKPQITDYSETEVDSLISVMINNFAVYNPSTGSIDEIINSGQLNLVQNEELRNQVTNWSGALIDTQRDAVIAGDHMFNILLPFLSLKANISNVPFPPDLLTSSMLQNKSRSAFPSENDQLLASKEFENLVSIHALNLMYMVSQLRKLQSYLEKTIQLIESEIEGE